MGPVYGHQVETWQPAQSVMTADWVMLPGTSSGTHYFTLEVWELSDYRFARIDCRTVDIEVRANAPGQPWEFVFGLGTRVVPNSPEPLIVYGAEEINFYPQDICGVSPCDTIMLVQMVTPRLVGRKANGDPDTSEVRWDRLGRPDLAARANCSGMNGTYAIDESQSPGQQDLWLNGYDPDDIGRPGRQTFSPGETPQRSWTSDFPGPSLPSARWVENNFPSAFVDSFILEYEIYAVCEHGVGQGELVGKAFWRWELDKSGIPHCIPWGEQGGLQARSLRFDQAIECAEPVLGQIPDENLLPTQSGGRPCP